MATNKHAMIRYQALDACFSNRYKKFYMEDLIDACNKALQEFYVSKEDTVNDVEYYVKRRTITATRTRISPSINGIFQKPNSTNWTKPSLCSIV